MTSRGAQGSRRPQEAQNELQEVLTYFQGLPGARFPRVSFGFLGFPWVLLGLETFLAESAGERAQRASKAPT